MVWTDVAAVSDAGLVATTIAETFAAERGGSWETLLRVLDELEADDVAERLAPARDADPTAWDRHVLDGRRMTAGDAMAFADEVAYAHS